LPSLTESEARARLAKPPAETDKTLDQWLRLSLGGDVKRQTENRYPAEGGYYHELRGVSVANLTPDNRAKAAQAYRLAMTPPTREQAEEWVAMLHAATAHRSEGEGGMEVALDLYANALRQYPADCARQACMNLATRRQSPNWFPTLSELMMEADDISQVRRLTCENLERTFGSPMDHTQRIEHDPRAAREAKEAERKRIAAEFRALAGQLGGRA